MIMQDFEKPRPVAVEKRDGSIVPYDKKNIARAIQKASKSARTNYDDSTLERLVDRVEEELEGPIADIETIQDEVVLILDKYRDEQFVKEILDSTQNLTNKETIMQAINSAFKRVDKTGEKYQEYRNKRAFVRQMGMTRKGEVDTTDMSMVIEGAKERIPFNRDSLMRMVIERTKGDVPFKVVEEISKGVEFSIYDAYRELLEQKKITDDEFELSEILLTELVNLELYRRGFKGQMIQEDFIGMKASELGILMTQRSKENSNLKANSSEANGFLIAENIRKKFALKNIFSKDVVDAHKNGRLHLHDLGMNDRVYCSGHSVEYIKKYGLELDNLDTKSEPAKHARTLTGHLNTFLASMQAYYAGALGLGFVNIMYAPYLEGMTKQEMKQEAQHLLFSLSQSAFSRGGQTLFLDANVHTGIPSFLRNVPAIGPGGKYMKKTRRTLEEEIDEEMILDGKKKARINENYFVDENGNKLFPTYMLITENGNKLVIKNPPKDRKGRIIQPASARTENRKIIIDYEDIEFVDDVPRYNNPNNPNDSKNGDVLQPPKESGERYVVYGDYEKPSQAFLLEMLEVWHEGDSKGGRFAFPKCDLHINAESFSEPEQLEIVKYACEIAGDTGDPYFVFDRSSVTLSACCRLRTSINDNYVLKHPESMRFCGFQNVTINLPQAAYRAKEKGKTIDEQTDALLKDIDESMDLAMKSHLEKKTWAESLMKPGLPLWEIGKKAKDGEKYADLNKATYIIGMVGLNECVQYITGEELHESKKAMEYGLRIMNHMYQRTLEHSEKTNLAVKIEESPAESATRRFIAVDKQLYPSQMKSVMKGEEALDENFYSNSIHLAADAPVDLTTRIINQAYFNEMTQAGAIIHAHVGEESIPGESILNMVKKTHEKTNAAQLTFSPTFTFCRTCRTRERGKRDRCKCGSDDVYSVARIVGYFSKIQDWNKSKLGEEKLRRRGDYSVIKASELGAPYIPEYPKEFMFHRHGKYGCSLCEISGKKISGLKNPKLAGIEIPERFYDLNDEKQRFESIKQGVSLTTYPTIILSGRGRELARWVGTEFTRLSSKDLSEYVKNIIEHN